MCQFAGAIDIFDTFNVGHRTAVDIASCRPVTTAWHSSIMRSSKTASSIHRRMPSASSSLSVPSRPGSGRVGMPPRSGATGPSPAALPIAPPSSASAARSRTRPVGSRSTTITRENRHREGGVVDDPSGLRERSNDRTIEPLFLVQRLDAAATSQSAGLRGCIKAHISGCRTHPSGRYRVSTKAAVN